MRRRLLFVTALAISLVASATTTANRPAEAAFPGLNGKIAFGSNRDGGNREIYLMSPDGMGQENISEHPALDSFPAWSADGTQIVSMTDRDGNFELYRMDADGSNQTRVTNNSENDRLSSLDERRQNRVQPWRKLSRWRL